MNDELKMFVIFVCAWLMFMLFIILFVDDRKQFQEEAVEKGAAYWCIEDHEKVFSWDKCDD